MKEQWKPITGWEDKYAVSSAGRFKNIETGRDRKTRVTPQGYHQIVLTRDNKQTAMMVHRVVAQEFIGMSDKPQVNHKDGNTSNNNVTNLEWVTGKQNIAHAIETGLFDPVGDANGNATLTETNVHWIKYLLGQGAIASRLANVFGVKPAAISKIKLGRTWSHV
jgi:hypothetical protein